jgi:thiosulfate/3-mercaptopyruvate sulfurtransferase
MLAALGALVGSIEVSMGVPNTRALVTTGWLAEHLEDPGVVVAEVDENTDLYEDGHILGAVKLHWREDLQNPLVRDVVEKDRFAELMSERGISNDTTVILYGDKNNWFAAYGYWYLKLYRHEDVRLLDGGRQKWLDEGRGMTVAQPTRPAGVYTPAEIDESIRVRRDEVLARLRDAAVVLVDTRSPQEFAGELIAPPGYEQEGASRAGHIPGAQLVPWATAVRDDGTFKSLDELREVYAARGVTPEKEVHAYCRIGERSAHTWFVLRELLGYERVRNYDGSWTEWGNLVDVPIER